MHVLDIDGSPLAQAGAGHPFIIEVSMVDVAHGGQPPVVKGIEAFHVKNAGMRITTVNGKTTSKYMYELRIDVPGSYSIGPAELVYNKQKLLSNAIRVTVGKEQREQQKTAHGKKKHAPILLRLSTDKERAVVGQRIICTLRFYLSDPNISLRQMIEQDSPELPRKHVRGPQQGTEILDGMEYGYVQWDWDVYPQNAGSHIIPAYGADYDRAIERDDFWGGLGRFFGDRVETKRVYSNAVSLEIDPLPLPNKELQGIGTFTALNVTAKSTVAKQSEGIVVTVEVLGDGDPDTILFSELKGIPDALKYYESTQTEIEEPNKKNYIGKRFEFIMQGLQTGSWEIPSQSFYYYDVKQKAFKTLQSAPLSITVMPGVKQNTGIAPTKTMHKEEHEPTIMEIHDGPWYPVRPSRIVPWWLFLLFLFLPISFVVYQKTVRLSRRRARGNYRAKRAHQAFGYARKQVKRCKKDTDAQHVYQIFIELFADRWQISMAAVSASYIEKRLRDVGMSDKLCVEWNTFFSAIAERAFGAKKIKKQDTILLDKAEQWIDVLETFL